MKTCTLLRRVFLILAVLLSDLMCAVVAYNYCSLQWGGRYAGYSAPASAAFVYVVPYGLGIAACVILALFFGKKARAAAANGS